MIWIIAGTIAGIGLLTLALALAKAAAPQTPREHYIDDYQQMLALGYFNSQDNITSGSSVSNK